MNLAISEFGTHGKRLIDLCNSIKLREGITKDEIMSAGFSNHYKPNLYYCTRVNKSDSPIGVTFNITIDAEGLFIKDIMVLDEGILQPMNVSKFEYDRCVEIINMFINKKVLVKKEG